MVLNFKLLGIFVLVLLSIIIISIISYLLITTKKPDLENYKKVVVVIKNKDGKEKAIFNLYVADSLEKRARGLMNVDKIGENEGMLFLMKKGVHGFWMKNVKFDLDVIGIENNKIVSLNTMKVCSDKCPTYYIEGEYVIEVNKGIISKYGIKKGDEVIIKVN